MSQLNSLDIAPEQVQADLVARQSTGVPLTRVQVAWLAAVAGLFAAVYFPTFRWLFDRWTMSVWHNAHGMLIPVVVAYFVQQELAQRRHLPASASALGFCFVIPALALHALDTGMHTQLLSAASIVLLLPGLSLLFIGRERTMAIAFPLAFMALMLPIPLSFTEPLHLVLRHIATAGASAVVPLLGITAYTEETTVHLTEATLQVGDGCSGFSTLYAACAVAALTAYNCPDWPRRILVLLGAAPIAIASNVLRVAMLIAIVDWTNVDVLSTWVHPASGMMTFALALPVIFWLGTPASSRREVNEVRQ
jgi:exosortase